MTSLSLNSFSWDRSSAEQTLVRENKDIKIVLAQKYIKGLLRKLISIRKRDVDLNCWCTTLKNWKSLKLYRFNASLSSWSRDSRQERKKCRRKVSVGKEERQVRKKVSSFQVAVWIGFWHVRWWHRKINVPHHLYLCSAIKRILTLMMRNTHKLFQIFGLN